MPLWSRRPACTVPGRHDARVDVEPVGRSRGTAVSGPVEPSKGARGHSQRAAEKAEQTVMKSRTIGPALLIAMAVAAPPGRPGLHADGQSTTAASSRTRPHV